MPRKNGKSALASGIALFGLLADVEGAEVYSVAGDREQARLVFGVAKRIVRDDPELSELVVPYKDALEVPSTGSVYRCLAAEASRHEGLSPTLTVFDEVHVQPNEDLWAVMTEGTGARRNPLTLGITTAGVMSDSRGGDSLCYRLYQHGREVAAGTEVDPSFYFAWWEPKAGVAADHTDPQVWAESNPGFNDLVDPEDFAAILPRALEGDFRTKRTNVFVGTFEPWLPFGAWDACADSGCIVPDGTRVALGFDGSFSRDSTALVGVTLNAERPHIFVVDAWERPVGADEEWRVDIAAVEASIQAACRRYEVAEVACDPYRWQRSMQVLEAEGVPIVEWPTNSAQRMVPACARFRDAVVEKRLTHDGDPRLGRHVAHCVIKTDWLGPRIVKDHKDSPRKIDLAVAAVVGFDRATQYEAPPEPLVRFI